MDKDPYFFKGLGSQTKLKNLVTQYSHKLPSILEDLHQKILSLSQSAFNESQWEEVNRQVHNLKGVSGTYGFSSISQNSALIESALLKKDFTNALAIIKSMMTMQPVINENRELPLFTKKNIKPEHIFLLDDDKNFIDYISTVLSSQGFIISSSTYPEKALNIMLSEHFDMIIIDIEMPEFNGLEICRTFREQEKNYTPVIVLTASTTTENRIKAFSSGADDFISKPVIIDELLARINIRMERNRLSKERDDALIKINKSNQHLLGILKQMAIGIATCNSEGIFNYISEVFSSLLDTDQKHLINKCFDDIEHFASADIKLPSQTIHIHLPNSSNRYLKLDILDSEHEKNGKMFYLRDITAEWLRQEQLKILAQETLLGNSSIMQKLRDQLVRVSAGDWTVLIQGESGTGKELVAKSIHDMSPRKSEAFIAINCSSVTETLIDSQLFGHRRGAFTGAQSDQKGVFEAANNGTLFLDEIGDIPLRAQTALLRVLEQHEIVRLGDTHARPVNVRVLAASHKNLFNEVQAGCFREDLYYRLNVIRIDVPPLRERLEDIPILTNLFISKEAYHYNRVSPDISIKTMKKLVDYSWPGNVRQLRNAVNFMLMSTRNDTIEMQDLPPELNLSQNESEKSQLIQTKHLIEESMNDWPEIQTALLTAKNNRTLAAKMLGISRATLYRRLDKLKTDDR